MKVTPWMSPQAGAGRPLTVLTRRAVGRGTVKVTPWMSPQAGAGRPGLAVGRLRGHPQ